MGLLNPLDQSAHVINQQKQEQWGQQEMPLAHGALWLSAEGRECLHHQASAQPLLRREARDFCPCLSLHLTGSQFQEGLKGALPQTSTTAPAP